MLTTSPLKKEENYVPLSHPQPLPTPHSTRGAFDLVGSITGSAGLSEEPSSLAGTQEHKPSCTGQSYIRLLLENIIKGTCITVRPLSSSQGNPKSGNTT